jgi:hypothetical protein
LRSEAVGGPAGLVKGPITRGIANTNPRVLQTEKRLIDRYEEVSGGIKADISPDPLPLPQEITQAEEKL